MKVKVSSSTAVLEHKMFLVVDLIQLMMHRHHMLHVFLQIPQAQIPVRYYKVISSDVTLPTSTQKKNHSRLQQPCDI